MRILYRTIIILKNTLFVLCTFIGIIGFMCDILGVKWLIKLVQNLAPFASYNDIWNFSYLFFALFIFLEILTKHLKK